MNENLENFSNSMVKETAYSFAMDKDYPLFIHMCGSSQCGPTYKISRDVTSYYTVEYIISGKGCVQENDRICYPQAGDTHIFHAGTNQRFFTDPVDPWVKVWVIFSGRLADTLFEIYDLYTQIHFPGLGLRQPIEKIIDLCRNNPLSEDLMSQCSVIVMEIIQKLYLYKNNKRLEPKALTAADKMKQIIDTMWQYDISMTDLAKQVYCSRNHAIRLFKNQFGISPYKYISDIRLKNSKRMLKNSNLPVGEIAKSLGFCDSRYFSNWFKKHMGCSPKDYRTSARPQEVKSITQ